LVVSVAAVRFCPDDGRLLFFHFPIQTSCSVCKHLTLFSTYPSQTSN